MLLGFLLTISGVMGQSSFLNPIGKYKANDLMASLTFAYFDVHDSLAYATGDNLIYCFHLESGELIQTYSTPSDYQAFSSFLTVSPDGSEVWAGFTTTGNTDDRIYTLDPVSGTWTLKATLAANFDLEFFDNQILVSGLNSQNWGDPNFIFLLDISGNNNHRKIIETGGNPAGFSVSVSRNLFYGTSFFSQDNALYRWSSQQLDEIIGNAGTGFLTLNDAEKLSDLPAGTYDCVADDEENVAFNINDFSSDKILAKWNGTSGNGLNFDTIALAPGGSDWLTMLKVTGNFESHEYGNHLFAASFGRPLAEVHSDYLPILVHAISDFNKPESAPAIVYNLNPHFSDPDDNEPFSYEVIVNSNPEIAQVSVLENEMSLGFLSAGQTNITIRAISAGQTVDASFVVGVYPQIVGDYEVSDFENLSLEPNSFWNGSDLSGLFSSGILNFPNFYNPSWASWSGWAYSNMADDSTAGYLNQYSSITARGFDVDASQGSNYAVGFVPIDFVTAENTPIPVYFNQGESHQVKGLYVTNSTYTALTLKYGDDFTKKFGGITGNDPDYFKLLVHGYLNGTATGPVEFFLADYRFEDNSKDYIIKTWQWVDLNSLGMIDSLTFNLSSSDVGVYGMNTPGYFCADHIYVSPETASMDDPSPYGVLNVEIYPNPAIDFIRVNFNSRENSIIQIFDFSGRMIFNNENYQSDEFIDVSEYDPGYYVIKIQSGISVFTSGIIKN